MTDKILFDDREAWLTEAANLILDDLIMPAVETSGYSYDRPTIRISVGFPKHSRGGKAIAVCFSKAASSDNVNEIFINPEVDEPVRVLDCVVHELIHAVDDGASGHRNFFARIARLVDLDGPLTATVAGPQLADTLSGYADLLGKFPHAKMNTDKVRRKDGTRQRKVECGDCGMIFRTSAKWMDRVENCPCCNSQNLNKD